MTENQELWRRLAAFSIDEPGIALPFTRRLARENGWSHEAAQQAFEEYRKFVYLAMVAGHPVTPSDEVDQVWHLHLCYTRSYWEDLCGDVLGKPLHHGPTRGGAREGDKFDGWYRKTLASYERVFGEAPPRRWWPAPEVRFAPRRWRRLDVQDHLVVSKRFVRRQVAAGITLLVLVVAAGCSSAASKGSAAVFVGFGVLGTMAWVWFSRRGGPGGPGSRGGNGSACGGGDYMGDGHSGGGDSGCGGSGCGGGGCGGCGGCGG